MTTLNQQYTDEFTPDEGDNESQYIVGTAASREKLTKPPKAKHTRSVEVEDEEEGELTVDICDAGDAIVVQSTVAGVKPEDIDISITDDTIMIRGKRERSREIDEANYYYKELFWGSFARSIILPEEVDEEGVEASISHGLLTITLPKKRKGKTQKIKVSSV